MRLVNPSDGDRCATLARKLILAAGYPRATRRHVQAIAAFLLATTLSACATTDPPKPVTTVPVSVPVAVKCRPNIGPDPAYPDTPEALKNASDLFDRVRLLVAGRLMRIAREAELQAAIKACEG